MAGCNWARGRSTDNRLILGGFESGQNSENDLILGCRGLNLIGCDLVEVSSPDELCGNTALLGANL